MVNCRTLSHNPIDEKSKRVAEHDPDCDQYGHCKPCCDMGECYPQEDGSPCKYCSKKAKVETLEMKTVMVILVYTGDGAAPDDTQLIVWRHPCLCGPAP